MVALVDEIKKLQGQGYNETAIVKFLREQGISPKEINDALSQVKIKAAISEETISSGAETPGLEGMRPSMVTQTQEMQEGQQIIPTAGMPYSTEQSTIQEIGTTEAQGYGYAPQYPGYETTQMPAEMQYPATPTPTEYMPYPSAPQPQLEYAYPPEYAEQGYGYAEYAPEYAGGNIETMNEVAEQVVNEKLTSTLKKIETLSEFKTKVETQVTNIDSRLQKIESSIDNLQASIVKRIGSYAQDVQDIKTELSTMQDSFSKVINPLTENIKEIERITKEEKKKVGKGEAKSELKESEKKIEKEFKEKPAEKKQKTKKKDDLVREERFSRSYI